MLDCVDTASTVASECGMESLPPNEPASPAEPARVASGFWKRLQGLTDEEVDEVNALVDHIESWGLVWVPWGTVLESGQWSSRVWTSVSSGRACDVVITFRRI